MGIYMKGDNQGVITILGKVPRYRGNLLSLKRSLKFETEFPLYAVEAKRNFHNITPSSGRDRVAQVGATS